MVNITQKTEHSVGHISCRQNLKWEEVIFDACVIVGCKSLSLVCNVVPKDTAIATSVRGVPVWRYSFNKRNTLRIFEKKVKILQVLMF